MRTIVLIACVIAAPLLWANSVVAQQDFRARIVCASHPCIDNLHIYKLKFKIWLGNELLQETTFERAPADHRIRYIPESAPTKARWGGRQYASGWRADIPVKVELWAWKKSDGSLYAHETLQGTTDARYSPTLEISSKRFGLLIRHVRGPFNAKGWTAINDPSSVWRVEMDLKIF